MYKLMIFDMDGTILDTLEDLTDSLNYVLKAHAFPERTLEEVRSFVGNGIRKLVERGLPAGTSPDIAEKVYQDFMAYYQEHCADKTKPYDGVIELIQKLREDGRKTAVVSNKADDAVQILCKQYFDRLFDAAVGVKPTSQRKPSPDMVDEILKKLNIDRSEAVYIGDSEVDLATAKNAGMDCICVAWGFRGRKFLESMGAEWIVSAPEEIRNFI